MLNYELSFCGSNVKVEKMYHLHNWRVIWFAILLLACSQNMSQYLPSSIDGYQLNKKLIGQQARQFVDRLHGKQVAQQENEIGFYRNGDRKITLYLTYYTQPENAQKDWQQMVNKISPQNSVFVQGKVLEMNGYQVYRTFGMGQTHFVFVHKNTLIWLSVPTIGSEKLFNAYVRNLK